MTCAFAWALPANRLAEFILVDSGDADNGQLGKRI